MKLEFTKMTALGNDFIMVDGSQYSLASLLSSVAFLCDRRLGVGGDGVIFILPAQEAENHYAMKIFNSDGSEAEMCGNGIRCFAKYVVERMGFIGDRINIETLCGVKVITMEDDLYRVDMGAPILTAKDIPVQSSTENAINEIITVDGTNYTFTAVSMGNPHAVIHLDEVTEKVVHSVGPQIETAAIFPEKTNVEFIRVINDGEIEMRVWERGCGETFACGTGACAAAVSGIVLKKHSTKVTVHLLGGDLAIEWSGNEKDSVFMTGPAQFVFDGSLTI